MLLAVQTNPYRFPDPPLKEFFPDLKQACEKGLKPCIQRVHESTTGLVMKYWPGRTDPYDVLLKNNPLLRTDTKRQDWFRYPFATHLKQFEFRVSLVCFDPLKPISLLSDFSHIYNTVYMVNMYITLYLETIMTDFELHVHCIFFISLFLIFWPLLDYSLLLPLLVHPAKDGESQAFWKALSH